MKLISETPESKTFQCGRCPKKVTFDKPVKLSEVADCREDEENVTTMTRVDKVGTRGKRFRSGKDLRRLKKFKRTIGFFLK